MISTEKQKTPGRVFRVTNNEVSITVFNLDVNSLLAVGKKEKCNMGKSLNEELLEIEKSSLSPQMKSALATGAVKKHNPQMPRTFEEKVQYAFDDIHKRLSRIEKQLGITNE